MSDHWKTCREMQIPCGGCGKIDSCTVSPDLTVFKCWRNDGRIFDKGKPITYSSRSSFIPATWETLQPASNYFAQKLGLLTGCWQYHDANGVPVMAVMRFDGIGGKQYRPFKAVPNGWAMGDPEGLLPLFDLPEVLKSQKVFVCEGEKAARAGKHIGLVATTSAHGASSASKTDWSPLSEKEVIILPDEDEAGIKYAQSVASILLALPKPAKVKIVRLPGLKRGDDLVEWLDYMKDHHWKSLQDCIHGYAQQASEVSLTELPEKAKLAAEDTGPVLTELAEVQPEAIRWLWEGKLALGKLSGWAGAPGDGKSIASIDVAARVSTGADWPDGKKSMQGSVLLITAEDGLADTIRPRLDAAGADVKKIKHFAMVRRIINGQMVQELFTLSKIRELEKTLVKMSDCKLIIVDPVGSFFGTEVDSNGDAAVRSVLAPIAALAEKYQTAVLLIMHTRKENGERADDQVMGSRAFTGIVRCMWHVRRDENDAERRLFLPGKNNAAKATTGLAYRVVDAEGKEGTAKVVWEPDPVNMTADEAVKRSRGGGDGESEGSAPLMRQQVRDWLERLLENGPRTAGNRESEQTQPGTILQEARTAGFAWRSVQRAASELGVMRAKSAAGVLWMLPGVQD